MTKCEHCESPATIHVTEMVNGAPCERHFCQEHAREAINDDYVRLLAPFSFSRMEPETMERLMALLEEAGFSGEERRGPLSPELAVPTFIKLLNDHDPRFRYFGAIWLGQMGPQAKEALPHVRALLDDENEYVRRAAEYALGKIER